MSHFLVLPAPSAAPALSFTFNASLPVALWTAADVDAYVALAPAGEPTRLLHARVRQRLQRRLLRLDERLAAAPAPPRAGALLDPAAVTLLRCALQRLFGKWPVVAGAVAAGDAREVAITVAAVTDEHLAALREVLGADAPVRFALRCCGTGVRLAFLASS